MIVTVKEKIMSHPGVVEYFKEFPFYNISTLKNQILNA